VVPNKIVKTVGSEFHLAHHATPETKLSMNERLYHEAEYRRTDILMALNNYVTHSHDFTKLSDVLDRYSASSFSLPITPQKIQSRVRELTALVIYYSNCLICTFPVMMEKYEWDIPPFENYSDPHMVCVLLDNEGVAKWRKLGDFWLEGATDDREDEEKESSDEEEEEEQALPTDEELEREGYSQREIDWSRDAFEPLDEVTGPITVKLPEGVSVRRPINFVKFAVKVGRIQVSDEDRAHSLEYQRYCRVSGVNYFAEQLDTRSRDKIMDPFSTITNSSKPFYGNDVPKYTTSLFDYVTDLRANLLECYHGYVHLKNKDWIEEALEQGYLSHVMKAFGPDFDAEDLSEAHIELVLEYLEALVIFYSNEILRLSPGAGEDVQPPQDYPGFKSVSVLLDNTGLKRFKETGKYLNVFEKEADEEEEEEKKPSPVPVPVPVPVLTSTSTSSAPKPLSNADMLMNDLIVFTDDDADGDASWMDHLPETDKELLAMGYTSSEINYFRTAFEPLDENIEPDLPDLPDGVSARRPLVTPIRFAIRVGGERVTEQDRAYDIEYQRYCRVSGVNYFAETLSTEACDDYKDPFKSLRSSKSFYVSYGSPYEDAETKRASALECFHGYMKDRNRDWIEEALEQGYLKPVMSAFRPDFNTANLTEDDIYLVLKYLASLVFYYSNEMLLWSAASIAPPIPPQEFDEMPLTSVVLDSDGIARFEETGKYLRPTDEEGDSDEEDDTTTTTTTNQREGSVSGKTVQLPLGVTLQVEETRKYDNWTRAQKAKSLEFQEYCRIPGINYLAWNLCINGNDRVDDRDDEANTNPLDINSLPVGDPREAELMAHWIEEDQHEEIIDILADEHRKICKSIMEGGPIIKDDEKCRAILYARILIGYARVTGHYPIDVNEGEHYSSNPKMVNMVLDPPRYQRFLKGDKLNFAYYVSAINEKEDKVMAQNLEQDLTASNLLAAMARDAAIDAAMNSDED